VWVLHFSTAVFGLLLNMETVTRYGNVWLCWPRDAVQSGVTFTHSVQDTDAVDLWENRNTYYIRIVLVAAD
jgi:hypothetical protein